MHQFTDQQIQDAFNKLPKQIQDALLDAGMEKSIQEIAKDNGVEHVDQIDFLINETSSVILGLKKKELLEKDIIDGLDISTSKSIKIIDSLNEKIFKSIRSHLEEAAPEENYDELKKGDILHAIENPVSSTESTLAAFTEPQPMPATQIIKKQEPVKALVEGTGEDLIEAPVQPNLIPKNIVEEKLTQIVRVPEIKKVELSAAPSRPISKLPPMSPKTSILKNEGSDPYLESI